jgi:GTP pyrophosphokinase
VGFGKIAPRQIFAALFPDLAPPSEVRPKNSAFASVVKKVFRRGESPITIKGEDDLLVYRAKCCNPIRGDDIVITEVEWVDGGEEVFTVRLAMAVEDRQGILAEITAAVSNLKTNIRESRSSSDGGKGSVELTVDVNDVKHLHKVMQELKTIRGIQDLERISRVP